jgi:hypothetical protein
MRTKPANEPWEHRPYLDLPGKHQLEDIWKDRYDYMSPPTVPTSRPTIAVNVSAVS